MANLINLMGMNNALIAHFPLNVCLCKERFFIYKALL
jgi:hypothetical protein